MRYLTHKAQNSSGDTLMYSYDVFNEEMIVDYTIDNKKFKTEIQKTEQELSGICPIDLNTQILGGASKVKVLGRLRKVYVKKTRKYVKVNGEEVLLDNAYKMEKSATKNKSSKKSK